MKQTLKIGITVLVVAALTMSGIALAQTDESATDQVAVQDTPAYGKIVEKLQPLVDDGTITNAQAEAVAEALAEGMRPHRGHRGAHVFKATAEFLGLTGDEMRAAIQEYDTLADLAAANGSSGDALIAFLVGQVQERLDQAVADGKIDQATADEKAAEAETKITEFVNSDIPEPGQGRRGPGGPGGFGGPPPFDGADASA